LLYVANKRLVPTSKVDGKTPLAFREPHLALQMGASGDRRWGLTAFTNAAKNKSLWRKNYWGRFHKLQSDRIIVLD